VKSKSLCYFDFVNLKSRSPISAGHGGKRAGAGRKPTGTISLHLRVLPETLSQIVDLIDGRRGRTRGAVVTEALAEKYARWQKAKEKAAAQKAHEFGSWRQILLAKKLGVPEALGYKSVEEWVNARIGGYARQSIDDRREAVRELSDEGLSQRDIGEVLGVSHGTVENDQNAQNWAEDGHVPQEEDADNAQNWAAEQKEKERSDYP
jgi:hypothetical protein